MVATLSSKPETVRPFLQNLIGETAFRLPAGTAADTAMVVLLTAATASTHAARVILQHIIPQMLESSKRNATLPVLANFTHTIATLSGADRFCV